MDGAILASQQLVAGSLLVLSGIIFAVGGFLYTARAIWKWPSAATPGYLRWERAFVMAALLLLVLGLLLLGKMLERASNMVTAPLGGATFLIGAVLGLAAETFSLSGQGWLYATIVVYIVLAFLGEALFGVALLQTGLLPAWVGWATVIWNLAWLVILPIARRQNMYYPWLHHAAPFLIGIMLLATLGR